MTISAFVALLTTKLHRPPVASTLVARPRLIEMLNRGRQGPLILVCAGAGFGKTTLVSSWLAGMDNDGSGTPQADSQPITYAWLTLDSSDSDLYVFLSYLIAALRTVFVDACAETLDLIRARQDPPPQLLATAFSNELAQLPEPLVLVLDDYESIRNDAIHDLISQMMRHWPPSLHLVLIARHNPSLPLARLRAKGQIVEIRSRDLRFTQAETAAYLGQTLSLSPNDPVAALLEQRTEGWIAGLQLSTLTLRNTSEEMALAMLSSGETFTAEYLVDEVLSRQPPAIQAFLLQTSILDRFCAPLCAAVVARPDAECNVPACIDWIERADLFVISLDAQRQWYRYHPLFQEMLRQRLDAQYGPDEVMALHRRAAGWLANHQLIDEALHHTLVAGDQNQAATLMEQGLCEVLNRDDRPTLERWLHLLPADLIARRPWLLMIKAWALSLTWQLGAVAQVLHQIEALLAPGNGASSGAHDWGDLQSLRGQIAGLRGQEAYMLNQPAQALAYCQESLNLVPMSWLYARGGFMLYTSMSMQALGQGDAAERQLLEQYENLDDRTDAYAIRLLFGVVFIRVQSGQLELARQAAQTMLYHASRKDLPVLEGWAHYFLGIIHYQWNALEDAGWHFGVLAERRYVVHAHAARNGLIGTALVHQARGDNTRAWQAFDLLHDFDLDLIGRETDETHALRARLWLAAGNVEAAGRWADAYAIPVPDRPLIWLQHPHITKVRILLARGSASDAQAAFEIANTFYGMAERMHNVRSQITGLVYQAVALDALGQTTAAVSALQRAVELAQPGGFVRVFVELGARMQSLLHRLATRYPDSAAIHRLLAEYGSREAEAHVVRTQARFAPPRAAAADLAEPLTTREREILALLREPLSGKDIARRLVISVTTFKRHTSNIYGKLGVHSRWEAVTAAESSGILPPR